MIQLWLAVMTGAWAQDVCQTGSCTYTTIGEAVDAWDGSDVNTPLTVGPGIYEESVLIQDKIIGIVSTDGPAVTVIRSPIADVPAVQVSNGSELRLEGFRIQTPEGGTPLHLGEGSSSIDRGELTGRDLIVDGRELSGPSFFGAYSSATIEDSVIQDHLAVEDDGPGALYIGAGAQVYVESTLVRRNQGCLGGAAFVANGGLLFTSTSAWRRNAAVACTSDVGVGGAIFATNDASVELLLSSFDLNTADEAGGHIALTGGAVMNGNQLYLRNGSATEGGGAIIVYDSYGVLKNSRVTGNDAELGGGLAVVSELDDNAYFTVENSQLEGNTANVGGGVYADLGGNLLLKGNRFAGNDATAGGALGVQRAGGLGIDSNAFTSNTARFGGGIFLVPDWSPNFGQIYEIDGNLFCANSVEDDGGAMFADGRPGVIRRNLFVENVAQTSGGALHTEGLGTDLHSNHFVGNAAAEGSAISLVGDSGGTIHHNLIVANENSAIHADGLSSFTSYEHNQFWSNDQDIDALNVALPGGAGNVTGIDPQLVAWSADGDCSNDDFHPQVSPPIDYGPQGVIDPDGTPKDIGALGGEIAIVADSDGDGVVGAYDCNDEDDLVYPGAPESCDFGDSDCDGVYGIVDPDAPLYADWWFDFDGDGWGSDLDDPLGSCTQPPLHVNIPYDCNDRDASVNLDAEEIWYDGIDQNCDGGSDFDQDGDGLEYYPNDPDQSDDCNDLDPDIPAVDDIPDDGIDQDCNGADTVTCLQDNDGDSFGVEGTETLSDNGLCLVVQNRTTVPGDCDDTVKGINPEADEIYNDGIDQDCSGADTVTCFTDADNDGFAGDGTDEEFLAEGQCGDGLAHERGDCNDEDDSVNPGAVEIPDDEIDQDCTGADSISCYEDLDEDGVGAALVPAETSCADAGLVETDGDCDDANADRFPGNTEVPDDGIDQDCSGADTITCFTDTDLDGYGGQSESLEEGGCGEGQTDRGGDCDDGDEGINPGATDVPDDQVDQDCNGIDATTCFADLDQDGFGGTSTVVAVDGLCDLDQNEAVASGDCDDDDPDVNPDGEEIPDDGIDQDCSGTDSITCFTDQDGDGFGTDSTRIAADGICDVSQGEADEDGDCDDENPVVYPTAEEVPYDDIDQDCDGADLVDVDGDGFPGGPDGTDCADEDPDLNPDAEDVPNDGIDQDCDAVFASTWVGGGSCSTTGVGGGSWAAVLLLLGLVRRRR